MNVKIKIMFDNKVEINCISKSLVDKIDLIIRKRVSISLVNIIEACARFEEVVENAKVSIERIIIRTHVFVVFRSNYKILLNRLF